MKAGKHSKSRYIVMIVLCVICAAAIIALCIFNIPIPINRTVAALEVNMADESVCIPREIQISGYYYINLGDDRFEGNITVSGYPETEQNALQGNIVFDEDVVRYIMDYRSDGEMPSESYVLGHLYADSFLRNMIIDVYEHPIQEGDPTYWAAAEATLIVTGVDSREEAMEKLEEMWWPWESALLG